MLGNADVPTPSRRVATLEADTATNSARRRHTTPVGLRRELRGDLDWIVVKAIERDRNRRYETANALALDLERHLEHKPVTARPPTLGYTTARFVRRHRLGVSVLATAAVALVVGVTGIMRERDRAARGEAKALAISTFLVDLFKSADPWQGGARQTTVVDALAEGVKQVNAGRIADPVIASSLRRTIATVYQGLGRNAEADTLYRADAARAPRADRSRERGGRAELERPRDHADVAGEVRLRRDGPRAGAGDPPPPAARTRVLAGTLLDLADLADHRRASSPARTRSPRRRSRSTGGRPASATSPWRWPWRRVLSIQGTGRRAGEGRVHRPRGGRDAARARGRAAPADRSRSSVTSAIILANQGKFTEALAIGRQTVSLDSSLFGTSHPSLATHLENLGYVYDQAGFRDSAMVMVKQVLAMRRAVLAADNPAIGRTLFNLASLEYDARVVPRGRAALRGGAAADAASLRAGAPRRGVRDRVAGAEPVLPRDSAPRRSGTSGGRWR